MKLFRLLFESTLSIKSVTYEQLPTPFVELPDTFDAKLIVRSEETFERWKKQFISRFGLSGRLVMIRPRVFDITGNSNWDKYVENVSKSHERY